MMLDVKDQEKVRTKEDDVVGIASAKAPIREGISVGTNVNTSAIL